ncbi:MAG: hypothetical protein HYR55_14065 [Acidobacteria bacterium]|nr:hypothetical protein [Acidobacteriota bacterium]MBI3654844.1 hypothetical protein [Acidobacteriota bacterium]
MGIVDEMKMLAQELIAGYEARLSAVEVIMTDTHDMLDEFKSQRGAISQELRAALAKTESLRKKDFDRMIREILLYQEEREWEIKKTLREYIAGQKKMTLALKDGLTASGYLEVEDLILVLKNIQDRQQEQEEDVRRRLKEFQKEQEAMVAHIRELLAKGPRLRIKEFKTMVKMRHWRRKENAGRVGTLTDALGHVHETMSSY